MVIDKSGCYTLTHDEYHADPVVEPSLSRSVIKDLLYECPAKAWQNHPRLNPNFKPDDDKKFDLGKASHDLLLEGIDKVVVIEAEDWRKKETKEKRDKAIKEGFIPLLEKDYLLSRLMVVEVERQILSCKELGRIELRKEGDSELSYIWQEPSGAWGRVRVDWISKDRKLIIDYKTTRVTANPDEVGRTIANMGLDIQESFYRRGVKAIEGINPKFVFIFQEVEPPYLCSFIGLPPEFQEMGKQKVEYGIFLWEECLNLGKWPAYPNKVCWVDPEPWALGAWEKRAQRMGGVE